MYSARRTYKHKERVKILLSVPYFHLIDIVDGLVEGGPATALCTLYTNISSDLYPRVLGTDGTIRIKLLGSQGSLQSIEDLFSHKSLA